MFRCFIALTVIAFGSFVFADASGFDEQEVTVKSTYKEVCDFIESHSDDIIKSSKSEVLERKGTIVKIKNNNEQEQIVFTIQEKNKRGDYGSELVKSHQGGLTSQKTSIKVTKGSKGTTISIKVEAEIENPRVGPVLFKVGIKKSVKGMKELFRHNL